MITEVIGSPPIEFNIVVRNHAGEVVVIDWGNSPKWVEQHRDNLDNAAILMLAAKPGVAHRKAVSVRLKKGQRWIICSRVAGMLNSPYQVRVYCLGYQETVGKKTVKTLLWVYPDGDIELSEKPNYIEHYLKAMRSEAQRTAAMKKNEAAE